MTSIDEDYDSSNPPSSSADTIPPLQFPSDDKAETSKNETALEILQKNSNTTQTKVMTEVKMIFEVFLGR